MDFAPIPDATLRNWHTQAVAAMNMMRTAGTTGAAACSPGESAPGAARTPANVVALEGWIRSLLGELTNRRVPLEGEPE